MKIMDSARNATTAKFAEKAEMPFFAFSVCLCMSERQ